MTLTRKIELWTDFQGPNKKGAHISTLGVGGGTLIQPEAGEEVTLFDGEGNSCRGIVEAVFEVNGNILVHTRADLTTWETSPVVDLMDALRGSVEEAKQAKQRRRGAGEAETDTERAEDTTIIFA